MRRLLLSAALLAGCSASAGAAPVSRGFTVSTFDRISVAGPFDVSVHTGAGVSVRAAGESQALDRLVVTVEDGTLRIRPSGEIGGDWFGGDIGKVKVTVTVPALRAASLAGSGDLTIDRARADQFVAVLNGSGDLTIGALDAERFTASVAGSGDLHAAGRAGKVRASLVGSGNMDAAGLTAADATVSVLGSGDLSLAASHGAAVSAMGSGDVTVTGTATCTVSQHGSGTVACGHGAG